MEPKLIGIDFAKLSDESNLLVQGPEPYINAIHAVLLERARQQDVEGFDADHDDKHDDGSLAGAGAAYALNAACLLNPYHGTPIDDPPDSWLFEKEYWKPSQDDPARDLVKDIALLLADLERIMRKGGDA